MKRAVLYVLVAMFAFAGYGYRVRAAQEMKQPEAAPKGQLRWHGVIVRWSKDHSTLDVRKGNIVKTIHYDSTTKWTKDRGKATAEMSDFTEGSDVICLGKAGEKGSFDATQIDLRTKG